jgi:amino acid transporter
MAIIVLSIVLAITVFFLLGALAIIGKMQKQLELIDREQHAQNKDIMDLIKYKIQSQEMLIQHVDILKYLVDRDEVLGKKVTFYTGPMGEA